MHFSPFDAARLATILQWFELLLPYVTTQLLFCISKSSKNSFAFRALLPPKENGIKSSRFMNKIFPSKVLFN